MLADARKPPFAVLIAVFMPSMTSVTILLPSMPGLQTTFGVDYSSVQLTLTFYLIGLGLAQLVYGPISDRIGRRSPLLVGCGMFIAGSLLCKLAPSIEVLIFGRLVQAVGACAGLVLCRAIVRDLYERDRAASKLADLSMATTVASTLAPMIGGFLDTWLGWRAVFAFLLILGLIVLSAAAVCLHETHKPGTDGEGFRVYLPSVGYLLCERAFLGYALTLASIYGTYSSIVGGTPFIVIQLMERSADAYGLAMGLVMAAFGTGNFIAGRISTKVGVDPMVAWGTTIGVVCGLVLASLWVSGWLTPVTLFVPIAVLWLTQGMVVPNAMAGSVSVNPRMAGAAAGITGFLQMVFGAGASYLVGVLLTDSAGPMVFIVVIGSTIAWLAHGLGVRWVRPPA